MATHILTTDVVLISQGHVLLILRRWPPHENQWALPGGHVDAGEQSIAAAVRELEEETGLRVTTGELRHLGRWDTPGRDPRGRYATDAYVAMVSGRPEAAAADDATDCRWFPLTDLPSLAFDHGVIVKSASPS